MYEKQCEIYIFDETPKKRNKIDQLHLCLFVSCSCLSLLKCLPFFVSGWLTSRLKHWPTDRQTERRISESSTTDLPPVAIILTDDLKHITSIERHPCLFAGDQRITRGVKIKQGPYVDLGKGPIYGEVYLDRPFV